MTPNSPPEPVGHPRQVLPGELGQRRKRLVDRVSFYGEGLLLDQRMHAAGHVPVKRIIGGQDLRSDLTEGLFPLEKRSAHRHAGLLHLLRPGDHAPVVVRQDRHGRPPKGRVENPLTGDVEVLTVDQGEDVVHGGIGGSQAGLNWFTALPHIQRT